MERHDQSQGPKIHRPEMSPTWWLKKRSYFLFMMRELSSVFVAAFALLLLYELFLLSKGPEVYGLFQESLRRPGFILFYVVAFVFSVYHTVTWFQAAAKIQVVKLGSWTMPGWMMTAGALVAWAILSGAIAGYFLAA
ncbi:MAG: fumarate reductase subunit C [Candidatus Latescibacterota bacterium]|nr:fumarate reductase subunit C [Candidatus Latescibacterota bacterium]